MLIGPVGYDRVIERAISREWQVYFTPWLQLSITADLSYDSRVRRAILGLLSTGSYVLDLSQSCYDQFTSNGRSCDIVACGYGVALMSCLWLEAYLNESRARYS